MTGGLPWRECAARHRLPPEPISIGRRSSPRRFFEAALAMPEEKYTRCPGCKTVFRVTAQQLAMRAGQVRCGHCKAVFDGNAAMVSLAPRHEDDVHDETDADEAALGPPTVTLRNAQALEPVPEPERGPAAESARDEGITEIAYEERFAWANAKRKRRSWGALYGIAIPLLLLLLVAQTLFHYRDALAAYWPAGKPLLTQLCEAAGCALRPLRDVAMNYLSIESSDLQADPAHKGLLILTANLRSHAAWPLAYPSLELTLTDAKDDVVVRRALGPADYAGGTADIGNGITPNGEVAIKLFIDASATVQAGYRLYMFYP
jgi:predicted Zn finger-like uncharacterized protein